MGGNLCERTGSGAFQPGDAVTTTPEAFKGMIDVNLGAACWLSQAVAVAPQLMDTPANRALFPPKVMARAVAPEVIAGLIAFLVSDAAAPVNGAILPAYGG
jgi:hypothetical protein